VPVQDVLDLGRIDVHAARDDHVALAVAERVIAVGVHARHVADRVPVAPPGLPRRLRALVVGIVHAAESPDVELARLADGDGIAVVVQEGDVDPGRRAAARAGLSQNVLGPQDGVDSELGRSVELVEARTEVPERLLLDPHRARSRRDHQRTHRGDVVARAHRFGQVDDALDQRGRHEGAGDPVGLDEAERVLRVEPAHDDHRPADDRGEEREGARRGMIERPGDQVHVRVVDHAE